MNTIKYKRFIASLDRRFLKNKAGRGWASAGSVYLLSNISCAMVPFILIPILTRYLSPEEYGQVAMFSALLSALAAFIGLNTHAAASRKYYDMGVDDGIMKSFVASCFQVLFVSFIVVGAVLFIFVDGLEKLLGLDRYWIMLAVVAAFANFIISLRLGQWQVRQQPKKYGVLEVSQAASNFLLSILLVVVLLQAADGRLAARVLILVAFMLIALYSLYKDGLFGMADWTPEYIKEALSYGVPLVPHVAGAFMLSAADRVIINSELGLAQAGVYMLAVQFAMALGLVFDAFNKAYVPWLFEKLSLNDRNHERQIVKGTYAYFVLALCLGGGLFIFAPWFVVVIAGEAYEGAAHVVGWLLLGQVFGGMYLMVTNYIFYSKRTGILSTITIISGCVNLVLIILMVNMFGLVGAGVAFSISMGVRFLFTWWAANRRHPMPWFGFANSRI